MFVLDILKSQIVQSMARKALTAAASSLGTMGLISGSDTELFIATGLGLLTLVLSAVSALTKGKALAIAKAVDVSPTVELLKGYAPGGTKLVPIVRPVDRPTPQSIVGK